MAAVISNYCLFLAVSDVGGPPMAVFHQPPAPPSSAPVPTIPLWQDPPHSRRPGGASSRGYHDISQNVWMNC